MSSRPSRGAARLAAILDALPDALLLVNCNGTVVNANTIALEAFETPGTALVGRGLLDLLPEFDSKRIPGSMRRPDEDEGKVRTKPTRMIARRTDGSEFPVEVTSASLEDGRTPYESSFEAAWADHGPGGGKHYTGDELLMLVVRDLTGTLDTEAELARQQRQTEMILRAASEGVVGVDTEGRIVLVNPAAAQILGYRAGDLGGRELHPLIHHSRSDGNPLPYEDTPLHDTLRSGRKHRVRGGQTLWAKDGQPVPVDMTTAPVRDGEQLVGAVLTFTDRRRYESLAERHGQLRAVLDEALRGPLDQLRSELTGLAADPAGQLWPEANQILHHLAAGYTRMTTLVDNVLGYQRLASGKEKLELRRVSLDGVVTAGVEGAIELIGPGRAQFAVHAPPIEAEVDPERLATALSHLIADVAGVDATGNTTSSVAAAAGDSTIVVAVAQRGDVVRIEVRGPCDGGSPVHEPIVRGIVRQHHGVLQTHDVPGAGGSALVLEVPVAAAHGGTAESAPARPRENETPVMPVPTQPVRGTEGAPLASSSAQEQGQGQGPAQAQAQAQAQGEGQAESQGQIQTQDQSPGPTRRRAQGRAESAAQSTAQSTARAEAPADQTHSDGAGWGALPAQAGPAEPEQQARPTGRRRGRPSPAEQPHEVSAGGHEGLTRPALPGPGGASEGGLPEIEPARTAGPPSQDGHGRRARRALSAPPAPRGPEPSGSENQGTGGGHAPGPAPPDDPGIPQQVQPGTGRRGRREAPAAQSNGALPALGPGPGTGTGQGEQTAEPAATGAVPAVAGGGRRARRLAAARARAEEQAAGQPAGNTPFALPPAPADAQQARPAQPASPAQHPQRAPQPQPVPEPQPQPQPVPGGAERTARATGALVDPRAQHALPPAPAQPHSQPPAQPPDGAAADAAARTEAGAPAQPQAASGAGAAGEERPAADHSVVAASPILGGGPLPHQPAAPQGLPMPGHEHDAQAEHASGGISVRTLGQGVPFAQRIAERDGRPQQQGPAPVPAPAPTHNPSGPSGPSIPSTPSTPTPPSGTGRRRRLATPPEQGEHDGAGRPQSPAQPQPGSGRRTPAREFAIGAPDAGAAEGPEPLDGPNGAVEVTDGGGSAMPMPPVDDELPPEPLDNPRRLLVWPEPDVSTQQALSDRGYRPVIVNSREEVDAQIAAYPAALFVDPLTGPITRTALQSLRQAAVAAEVPVLVTAGLGQATREAAYGADPAVLLKALAPRDSEQHPPRVLLVEEHDAVAGAFTTTLERRGMQVAHAPSDSDAVDIAAQVRPNLVVMDLMQVRRRRAGIIDWLRVNGLLNRTPFVVYTSAGLEPAALPRLAAGETVLFLAERSTSGEVQARIVDLLAKIGAS